MVSQICGEMFESARGRIEAEMLDVGQDGVC